MKTYYEEPGITIFHGDALFALDHLRNLQGAAPMAQAIITDPPYASGTRAEAKKGSSGAMVRGGRFAHRPIENDQMTTQGWTWLMREFAYAAGELLEDGGSLLVFNDWRQWPNLLGAIESCDYRVNNMVVWDKMHYALGNGFRGRHELVMHASKGVPAVYHNDVANIIECDPTDAAIEQLRWDFEIQKVKRDRIDDHPTPKPVELMRRLMRPITRSGMMVVDPFMGIGSTLVAAKESGRRAVGIEISEHYCEIAALRLQQTSFQSTMQTSGVAPSNAKLFEETEHEHSSEPVD